MSALSSLSLIIEKINLISRDTMLEINVIMDNGCCVDRARIVLYDNIKDMELNKNPICTDYTNKKGQVVIRNLKHKDYFFYIQKGDLNNYNGVIKTWVPLLPGKRAVLLVKITKSRDKGSTVPISVSHKERF